MQSVAMEMQLSETAFVHPSGEGFDLRWFTPAAEVELCGRGVGLTAPASRDGFDYVARFFAPRLRIDEDPVTGSLQCALGPWWQRRTGRDRLDAYQASARGGALRVFCRGDRVTLSGRAVTVLRAELLA